MQQFEQGVRSSPFRVRDALDFRHPNREDGQAVHELIESCGTLDVNSLYCTFLQCTHFANTCMLAEVGGEVVGWVSGYRPQEEPNAIFVWQVAVAERARGRGLAKHLIARLIESRSCVGVDRIKTTITPDNEASWRTFGSMARTLDAPLSDAVWLCEERHFGGEHGSEHLLTIGPFGALAKAAA